VSTKPSSPVTGSHNTLHVSLVVETHFDGDTCIAAQERIAELPLGHKLSIFDNH